jgi:vanadium chloroperoxidase
MQTGTVRYWVDAALECNRRDHTIVAHNQRGPFRSARALGMTLMAMHDAWFAVSGGTTPYHATATAQAGATAEGAATAAAAKMLFELYPSQFGDLLATLNHATAAMPLSAGSKTLGEEVASKILQWRAGDTAFTAGSYIPTGAPYDHNVDPVDPGQGFQGALWGQAPAFLADRQPLEMPPGADASGNFMPGPHYTQEFAEVNALGAEHSSARSADQEEIGIFWAYDGPANIGTPPRLYMQVALEVLDGIAARPDTWLDEAHALRALTAAAVAMADAGIQAWFYKYSTAHMLWRPVLGIRKAPDPTTPADPTWRPLGRPDTNGSGLALTPNFPAYPSGHATFGAAAFEVLRRYIRKHDPKHCFGDDEKDNIAFTFVSDEFDGMNRDPRSGQPRPRRARHYPSLWRAIVDNSESRIFLGVHWRFDGLSKKGPNGSSVFGRPDSPGDLGAVGGVRLGMDIAKVIAGTRGFA